MMSSLRKVCAIGSCLAMLWLPSCPESWAQNAPPAQTGGDPQDLNGKIELLTRSLQQTRTELAQSRTEIEQLRATLEEALKRMESLAASLPAPGSAAGSGVSAAKPEEAPRAGQISQEDWDLLNARVEEQRQTKVESGSKFRLKLSGLALFNAFDTSGQVDNLDVPAIAVPRFAGFPAGGSGASVRQSIIGLTGIGPELFGARTSADLQLGFYGGLPSGYTATSSGISSLRFARVRFDWENTSAIALKVEAGILDPSSNINYAANNNLRAANPAESSRIPTYAVRVSYNKKSEAHPTSFGVSGLSSPQEFYGGYRLTGWVATADWKFSLAPRTELSGQFFTGRGIEGFGGLPENAYPLQNQFVYATLTARLLAEVGVIGGWSQLKLRWNARNEFNVAAGTGGRNSAALRRALGFSFPAPLLPARNQMMFANYIFRPRSDLLFSAEYRRLRTYEINGSPDTAGQVGLAVGFLF